MAEQRPAAPKQSFWDNPANTWIALPIILIVAFAAVWGVTRFFRSPTGPTVECHRGMNVTDDCDY